MRSLQVAFDVLEEIAKAQVIGVSELARKLSLPKATVQRSLQALAATHYIVRAKDSQWQLSGKVLVLTSHLEFQKNLIRAARPAMDLLCEEVDETVHLTIREDNWIVLIDRVEPARSVRATSHVGNMQLAHSTSTGKAMLASLTDEEIAALLGTDLEKTTEHTVGSLPELLKVLATVRQRGYAVNDREYNLETTSVAAPIRDWNGRTVAGLSISAPTSRLKRSLWKKYGLAVAHAASTIRI